MVVEEDVVEAEAVVVVEASSLTITGAAQTATQIRRTNIYVRTIMDLSF